MLLERCELRHASAQRARDRAGSRHLVAGNVLRAAREPWLVIDPKPFIGDPAYDATQHLLNCVERLRADPLGTPREDWNDRPSPN
jgi:streptomycin 6-kinase